MFHIHWLYLPSGIDTAMDIVAQGTKRKWIRWILCFQDGDSSLLLICAQCHKLKRLMLFKCPFGIERAGIIFLLYFDSDPGSDFDPD
jgi:hypothetical protein